MVGSDEAERKITRVDDWLDDLQARAERTLDRCRAAIDKCKELVLNIEHDREALEKQK